MLAATVLLLSTFSLVPLPLGKRLDIGAKLASGQYGSVFLATWDGSTPAVAKVADGVNEEFASAYLKVEKEVNEAIEEAGDVDDHFCRYLGAKTNWDGSTWLVWERLEPCAELSAYAGDRMALESAHGLTPRSVLRNLLECVMTLHEIGYVHRDVKLENILVDSARARLRLIDFGSAAFVDGCTLVESTLGRCTSVDPNQSPCSPLYAAPEQYLDPAAPFAFDCFSIGICFLRLSLRSLASDEALAAFREELRSGGGDLEAWISMKLLDTAVDSDLVEDLSVAFPGEALGVVCAMLRADPSRRPTLEALLAHPWLGGAMDPPVPVQEAPQWLERLLSTGEDEDACELPPFYEITDERQLVVLVRLAPPLGILLGETSSDEERAGSGASLAIDDVVDGYAAANSRKVRVGDRLVSIDGVSVRDWSLEKAMDRLGKAPKRPAGDRSRAWFGASRQKKSVLLGFERGCTAEACELAGTGLDVESGGEQLAFPELFAQDLIADAGAAEWLGKRTAQEDAHVLTMFSVVGAGGGAPSTCVLAACFDGHRGPQASAFAAKALPDAVRRAIEAGDPSPLAAAWRTVADDYAATGAEDGSCAAAALIRGGGSLEILNCGDSRCVLGSAAGEVKFETRDHAAGDPMEVKRLEASGGKVKCGAGGEMRVLVPGETGTWQVAVSRALGGSEWADGGISNAADVRVTSVGEDDLVGGCLVLASDGIWGVLSSEDVMRRVVAARAAGKMSGDIAEGLIRCAEQQGGTDNTSCVVIIFA